MINSTQQSDNERWDEEGGSQLAELERSLAMEKLEEADRRILAFLGASVLSLWDELPDDARQKVLNRELVQRTFDESVVKARIAQLFK
ncbi:hypothetical protein [Bordetella genomosp. 7]|uniref:Uncharacterized protein n=1 Tax=Bordetella genomosp. 7 TaxID=1416805 RepID=A0A261QYQ8_9BORD|nr:hypothetical protein [Bordetella genomosp. 7]OZI17909.1 hypothetical protein CAL19_12555 [Bordetella genomosp. 7]